MGVSFSLSLGTQHEYSYIHTSSATYRATLVMLSFIASRVSQITIMYVQDIIS